MTKALIGYFLTTIVFIGSKSAVSNMLLQQSSTPTVTKKRTQPKDSSRLTDRQIAKTIKDDGTYINHGFIGKDSMIWVPQNKYRDHRIFGYEKPDSKSRKMLLISIFTDDVEGNPHRCPYGAYYSNTGNNVRLKYRGTTQGFVKADVSKDGQQLGSVYILRKWLKFE